MDVLNAVLVIVVLIISGFVKMLVDAVIEWAWGGSYDKSHGAGSPLLSLGRQFMEHLGHPL